MLDISIQGTNKLFAILADNWIYLKMCVSVLPERYIHGRTKYVNLNTECCDLWTNLMSLFMDNLGILIFVPVPGEPRDVSAKPFNLSSILVEWKPPVDEKKNGIIRAYQIYIQPKKTVSTKFIQSDE